MADRNFSLKKKFGLLKEPQEKWHLCPLKANRKLTSLAKQNRNLMSSFSTDC